MSFANPYNFISIDEENIHRKKNNPSHERFSAYSGKLVCRLYSITNLLTAGENNSHFKKQVLINGKPGIHASSLKGMLRSTAEAISNSCISQISEIYKYRSQISSDYTSLSSGVDYKKINEKNRTFIKFNHKHLLNEKALIDSCNEENGLCICCRLFGTTTVKENSNKEESFTHKGKIMLSDAEYIGLYVDSNTINEKGDPCIEKFIKRHSLSNPKNHHESFYLNGNKIKGRKFYYHQKDDKFLPNIENDTIQIYLVKEGAIFKFYLAFENLTKEEYGLLMLMLELEPWLCHKIGMGKPLGLGSCKLQIMELKEFHENRYNSISKKNSWKTYEEDAFKNRIKEIRGWWNGKIPDNLNCILKYHNKFTEIRYPDRERREFRKYVNLHKQCEEFK